MAFNNIATGTIGENPKKTNPKQPDYLGSITLDGRKLGISAWRKFNQDSETVYFSFNITENTVDHSNPQNHDDDIPF